MTVDGEITLIGSANMDRRSFDLNYENNILLCDPAVTAEMRSRRQDAISPTVGRLPSKRWPPGAGGSGSGTTPSRSSDRSSSRLPEADALECAIPERSQALLMSCTGSCCGGGSRPRAAADDPRGRCISDRGLLVRHPEPVAVIVQVGRGAQRFVNRRPFAFGNTR